MSTATIQALFFGSYALTGVALASALILGRKRAIRGHITSVIAFVVGFLVVLVWAEMLGHRLAFDPTIEHIHLPFAFAGAASLLGPLVTGFRRWKGKGSLRAHHLAVGTFLVLFVIATGTGIAMLSTGKPREPETAGR